LVNAVLGASALSRRTAIDAAAIWLASVGSIVAVGIFTVLSGHADEARALLGFTFPARESWTDLVAVLWRNGGLAAWLFIVTRGRLGGGAIMIIVPAAWLTNLALVGMALGGYGERLVRHAAVYGLLELAGFSVVLAACLRVRRESRPVRRGELLVSCPLLIVAAFTETICHARL
jgi:hypothetical protein